MMRFQFYIVEIILLRFLQFYELKRCLSNCSMNNTIFINFKINFTSFNISYSFATSIVTVPVFGFGIKPLGPKTLPKAPNFTHTLRHGNNYINISPSTFDFVDILIKTNIISSSIFASSSLSGYTKAKTLHLFQYREEEILSSNHLVGFSRIYS